MNGDFDQSRSFPWNFRHIWHVRSFRKSRDFLKNIRKYLFVVSAVDCNQFILDIKFLRGRVFSRNAARDAKSFFFFSRLSLVEAAWFFITSCENNWTLLILFNSTKKTFSKRAGKKTALFDCFFEHEYTVSCIFYNTEQRGG